MKTWVVKPEVEGLWHFYNVIEGRAIDFTISQFDEPIRYDNISSNRDEAFADTNSRQYSHLSSGVKQFLQSA